MSQQKNSTKDLKRMLISIIEKSPSRTLTHVLRKTEGMEEFVFGETSDFESPRSFSFRAKTVASGGGHRCLNCGSLVNAWGQKACSIPCRDSIKSNEVHSLTPENIFQRILSLINSDEIVLGQASDLVSFESFCCAFNRIYNLKEEDMLKMFSSGVPSRQDINNKKRMLLVYLLRVAVYQGVSDDLFEKCMKVEAFPKKSENTEFFSLIYGAEEASRKLSKKSDRVIGDKNPAYQHGGRLSPFSEKFIKGDIRKATIDKANKTRDMNSSYQTRLDYWFKLCRGDVSDASELLYNRQSTFSREKLVAKYGEEKGIRIWEKRQEKWLQSLSKLSEEEKILIRAKQGFWRYTTPMTDEMDVGSEKNSEDTILYVIEYKPVSSRKSYIKIGVTNRRLTSRFPLMTIKDVIFTNRGTRYNNFHIERDVKSHIFKNKLSILIESESDKFDGWTECVAIEHKEHLMGVVKDAISRY